jgi:hypothetical protein
MSDVPDSHRGLEARRLVGRALSVIRQHKRAYIGLNLAYYGLVGLAMVFVASSPDIQQALTDSVILAFSEGPLAPVAEAYNQGNVLTAAFFTFVVNFFAGTLLVLFVPSLVIPFGGVAFGLVRATLWGLLLAPTSPELRQAMIPHSLTLVLEGQGYILAMLAAWVHGLGFVSPRTVDQTTHLRGWLAGLRRSLWLYVLVVVILAIAAVYEAIEVIYIVPRLVGQ